MLHKISQMCDKVNVMYEKSMNLRRLKYDTPKDKVHAGQIDFLVADIQQLAREIANDKQIYERKGGNV